MPFINWEIILIITLSANCIIINPIGARIFAITDTKHYILVVNLSTKDNTKLLQESRSNFKRTINWSTFQSKAITQMQNQYLDYLIDPSFQGGNTLFISSPEKDNAFETVHTGYFLPKVKIKDYIFMIRNFFDQPAKNDLRTYDNIRRITTGQVDDYTTGRLLDYPYFF